MIKHFSRRKTGSYWIETRCLDYDFHKVEPKCYIKMSFELFQPYANVLYKKMCDYYENQAGKPEEYVENNSVVEASQKFKNLGKSLVNGFDLERIRKSAKALEQLSNKTNRGFTTPNVKTNVFISRDGTIL